MIFFGETGNIAHTQAFADGYQAAMLVGAGLALAGAVLSWMASIKRRPAAGVAAPGRDSDAAASRG